MTGLETLAVVSFVPLCIVALRAADAITRWARRDALRGMPGNFKRGAR